MMIEILLGSVVGVVLGLTGAGGGMLAVPALVLGLGWSLPEAAPVALLAVGLAAALGAVDGLRKGLVRWRAALLMATTGSAFSFLGAHASHLLPHDLLLLFFAIAMLLASARLLQQNRNAQDYFRNHETKPAYLGKNCMLNAQTGRLLWTRKCAATLVGIGSIAGLLTGMLGVGGGFLLVPAFRQWSDIHMHAIVATSLFVVAFVSIATLGVLAARGHTPMTGGVFIAGAITGMTAGRIAVPHLPARSMQIGFALFSSGVALYLLLTSSIRLF